jgi:metallo-beta-lactamase class B
MKPFRTVALALGVAFAPALGGLSAASAATPPEWTTPLPPFRITDHLYYVGSRDLAAYLVATPDGDVLINANLESSPPLIRASVEQLGFHWSDIRILVNSQAHFDHMGGAAQVLKETHAGNFVMRGDEPAVRSGGREDFAFVIEQMTPFAPTHVDHVLEDGELLRMGDVTLTAVRTAGHTRGCTTWVMNDHVPGEPAGTTRRVVIVGGFAALPHYRLVDAPGAPSSYPGIADDFRHTFATLRSLRAEVFLGAHGLYFGLLDKLRRMATEGPSVFIDPAGYAKAIDQAEREFDEAFEAQSRAAQAARAGKPPSQ